MFCIEQKQEKISLLLLLLLLFFSPKNYIIFFQPLKSLLIVKVCLRNGKPGKQ